MKRLYYFFVLFCGISICFHFQAEKKADSITSGISFKNEKENSKENVSVNLFKGAKVSLPFKIKKKRGLKGSDICLSPLSTFQITRKQSEFILFAYDYYYFRLFNENEKRGPPSHFQTT